MDILNLTSSINLLPKLDCDLFSDTVMSKAAYTTVWNISEHYSDNIMQLQNAFLIFSSDSFLGS